MELGLFQKQTMNLVMTTELRQAIALLQYNTIDLSQFIQEQAVENPLIELEEQTTEPRFEDVRHVPNARTSTNSDVSPLDFIANDQPDLYDDLMEQAQYLNINEQERGILQYLILNLDDHGLLPLTSAEIADQLTVNTEMVDTCIAMLQRLEPIGVGARDIYECLLLQATYYYPGDELLAIVIEHHLEALANKKWKELAKQLNISLQDVKQLYEQMITLNPRPCAGLFNSRPDVLYPDVTVENVNGTYTVSLNDHYLPKIHLNETYMSLKDTNPSASSYIKDHYRQYQWLVKSIEQRKATIIKITNTIIEKQRPFLEHGFSDLHPMTLKEVADAIGMHESTVSRATNNKVIQTPSGSYEMSRLFTSKLGTSDNSNASSAQVKILLKQLIDNEDQKKPLSDQKLAEHVKKHNGITISRRTVAKYREELNILSSSKRKIIS